MVAYLLRNLQIQVTPRYAAERGVDKKMFGLNFKVELHIVGLQIKLFFYLTPHYAT
jgi:hypothetical protein